MNTEIMDKLYLEYSQITSARTARELSLISALHKIRVLARRRDTITCDELIQWINGEIGNDTGK